MEWDGAVDEDGFDACGELVGVEVGGGGGEFFLFPDGDVGVGASLDCSAPFDVEAAGDGGGHAVYGGFAGDAEGA